MLNEKVSSACKNLAITSIIGLLISVYGFYVETNMEKDHDYKAMCDINEAVSCSKVFASEYGKGFGIIGKILGENSALNVPNPVYGMFFYGFMALISLVECANVSKVQRFLSLISNILSVYLAYLLYFVIQYLCVVCVALYVVNAFLLYYSIQKLNAIKDRNLHKSKFE